MTSPDKFNGGDLLKLKEVLAWLRISKSTWYDGVDRQVFPQPVRIGTRSVFWFNSDIEDYIRRKYGGPGKSGA